MITAAFTSPPDPDASHGEQAVRAVAAGLIQRRVMVELLRRGWSINAVVRPDTSMDLRAAKRGVLLVVPGGFDGRWGAVVYAQRPATGDPDELDLRVDAREVARFAQEMHPDLVVVFADALAKAEGGEDL